MGQGRGRGTLRTPVTELGGGGGGGGHLLPGPITHAGKIESDYQAEDLHTNIRAVGRAEMRARINIMSSNIW